MDMVDLGPRSRNRLERVARSPAHHQFGCDYREFWQQTQTKSNLSPLPLSATSFLTRSLPTIRSSFSTSHFEKIAFIDPFPPPPSFPEPITPKNPATSAQKIGFSGMP